MPSTRALGQRPRRKGRWQPQRPEYPAKNPLEPEQRDEEIPVEARQEACEHDDDPKSPPVIGGVIDRAPVRLTAVVVGLCDGRAGDRWTWPRYGRRPPGRRWG